MAKKTSGRGQRDLRTKVKTARGRKLSSTRWLERQLNDPYVKRAQAEGYRGRAAYKILELDDKYRFLVPGARVVDLGCAPGRGRGSGSRSTPRRRSGRCDVGHGRSILGAQADRPPPHHRALRGGGGTGLRRVVAGRNVRRQGAGRRGGAGAADASQAALREGGERQAARIACGSGCFGLVLASRQDSSEKFVVATGFKGRDA